MRLTTKYQCVNCQETYDVEGVKPGEVVECPSCGIAMKRLAPAAIVKRQKFKAVEDKAADKEDNWQNIVTCYAFGMLLLIPGIIIAYFGSGKKGASYAARGAVIGFAILVGLYAISATH